jgi:hypothetical protein
MKIDRNLLPFWFRNFVFLRIQKRVFNAYKKKIVHYYRQNPSMIKDSGMKEAVEFLETNAFATPPYPFTKNYSEKNLNIAFDPGCSMHYCILEGKRLYFKRGMEVQKIRRQFNNLLLEQDPQSAHRYLSSGFEVAEGDVVIDAGAAEGNFSLSIIEKVSKLILIETNPAWLDALEATFKPWKEKVIIINKFVSDHNSASTITIDKIIEQEGHVNFIKIDVDGEEGPLLSGSKHTLRLPTAPKIAICVYHREGDPEKFDTLLKEYGFQTVFSDGYMIFISQQGLEFPYLRKGLLKARKA